MIFVFCLYKKNEITKIQSLVICRLGISGFFLYFHVQYHFGYEIDDHHARKKERERGANLSKSRKIKWLKKVVICRHYHHHHHHSSFI